jgi:hypothetical protein
VLRVVTGVAAFNLVLLVVGYCFLAPFLRGRSFLTWLTWAGVALLAGASLVGVTLSAVAVAGASTGPVALAVVSATIAAAGLLAVRRVPASWRGPTTFSERRDRESSSAFAVIASAAGAYGVAAMCGLMLFAAFRSSPWLDDAWTFWLPKGIFVSHTGLDLRVFGGDPSYVQFANADYPLWWSIITGLVMRFVGRIDLRAVDAQLALLVVAFFGAAARLLWGSVRSWILWPVLLVLAACPELLRQTQSGGADLPLAAYVGLTVLAAVGWLARRQPFFLVLVTVFGAAAASIKVEGAAQLILLVAVPAAFTWRRAHGHLRPLYLSLVVALLVAAPWFIWSRIHDLPHAYSLGKALDPAYLAARAERVSPSAHELGRHLTSVREWLLVVPAFVAAGAIATAVERRWLNLTPVFALVIGYAFLIWIYWSGQIPLGFWLQTSAYRVVDSLIVTAGVFLPLVLERLASLSEQRRYAR